MKSSRQRYQHGNVRKVTRSQGFAWEFRYYFTDSAGKRRLKVQTFDSLLYKTERDVRTAVAPLLASINSNTLAGKATATFGHIIDRYYEEDFKELKHSTQMTNKSLLELHVRPRWGESRLSDLKAMDVKPWIMSLDFGPASKVRTRNIISKLLSLAMYWEYIPQTNNPMELVKIKGGSKRRKALVIITPDQCKALVAALPEPYSLMVLVVGCLGLRVSEMLALKWDDLNLEEGVLSLERVFTHGEIQEEVKTDASEGLLPLYYELVEKLVRWRDRPQDHEFSYVFPSPKTGSPYSDSTVLTRYLKPAGAKLGFGGIGWHSLRHSYKSWIANAGVTLSAQKDLMRHSDISTTANIYGKTILPELREANEKAARLLF